MTQSSVARAITNFTPKNWAVSSGGNTPTHSQPPSPMRKEISPFTFTVDPNRTAFGYPKKDTSAYLKLQRVIQERQVRIYRPV